MRDFPLFTTENGVGSLVLKEIPYSGIAYVSILDSSIPIEFLKECLEFCRIAGAKCVYAKGHAVLEDYPYYMSVFRMSASSKMIPDTDAALFPVTDSLLSRWQEIYNFKMKHVDNSAYMSDRAAQDLLMRGDGYFIHKNGELLGIGIAADDHIDCVASIVPGGGKEIVKALNHALFCDRVFLEVSSTNRKAIKLYESLGFIKCAEISKWYKIF